MGIDVHPSMPRVLNVVRMSTTSLNHGAGKKGGAKEEAATFTPRWSERGGSQTRTNHCFSLTPFLLKKPQRHPSINRSSVSGEKNLLTRGLGMRFTADYLSRGGILRIGDVIDLDVQLRKSEP